MSRLAPLIELQSIDHRIRDLQQVIDDIPLRKEKESQRLAELREQLEAAQIQYKNAQAEVDQAELETKSFQEKLTKLRQQQMALKTNKEFKAMELEIATVEQAIDRQESEQLIRMERVEPGRNLVMECRARLDEEQSVVDAYQRDLDAQQDDAAAALAQAEQERQTAVDRVDGELYAIYLRLAAGKWPVIVRLEGDSCGGCHMTQPPSIKHLARRKDGLANCHFCGRMIYD